MKSYVFKQEGYLKGYSDGHVDERYTNVLFIAGVHGNELGTIRLAYQLIEEFEDYGEGHYKRIGLIGVIPCVNQSGMRNNTRDVSENYADLNRGWDDDPRSDLLEEIGRMEKEYGIKFHIIVDMHCSPNIAPVFLLNRDQMYINQIVHTVESFNKEAVEYLEPIHCCVRDTRITTFKRTFSNKERIVLTYEQSGYEKSNPQYNASMSHYITEAFLENIVPKLRDVINVGSSVPDNYIDNHFDCKYLCQHIICNTEGILRLPTAYGKNGAYDLGYEISNGDIIAEVLDVETNELIEEIKWYYKPNKSFPDENNARIVELETECHYERYVTPGTIIAMIQPIIPTE